MKTTTPALPESARDLEALLGFRFEIGTRRAALAGLTRAASIQYRHANRFCRQAVSK